MTNFAYPNPSRLEVRKGEPYSNGHVNAIQTLLIAPNQIDGPVIPNKSTHRRYPPNLSDWQFSADWIQIGWLSIFGMNSPRYPMMVTVGH